MEPFVFVVVAAAAASVAVSAASAELFKFVIDGVLFDMVAVVAMVVCVVSTSVDIVTIFCFFYIIIRFAVVLFDFYYRYRLMF